MIRTVVAGCLVACAAFVRAQEPAPAAPPADPPRGGAVREMAEVAHRELSVWFQSQIEMPRIVVVRTDPPPEFEAAAFENGEIRLEASSLDRPIEVRRLVRHEMAHAFVRSLAGERCPRWIQEGIAQLHDGTDPESARRLLRALPRSIVEPLYARPDGFAGPRENVQGAYALSLASVDALVRRAGRGALLDALRRIGRGQEHDSALRRACGISGAELRQTVRVAVGAEGSAGGR